MHLLLLLVAIVLTVINTFGSWAVSRRRRLVSWLFLLAAAVLTVTAVAYAYRLDIAWWGLLAGSVLTFVASFLNAQLVLGRVEWLNHLIRGLALAAVVVAAWFLG